MRVEQSDAHQPGHDAGAVCPQRLVQQHRSALNPKIPRGRGRFRFGPVPISAAPPRPVDIDRSRCEHAGLARFVQRVAGGARQVEAVARMIDDVVDEVFREGIDAQHQHLVATLKS